MRLNRAILGLLMTLGTVPAQLTLEELRDAARNRLQEMSAEFKNILSDAATRLRRIDPGEASDLARNTRNELVPWTAVFHERVIEAFKRTSNQNLRGHLASVLAAVGTPPVAQGLLALLGTEGEALDVTVIRAVGFMTDVEAGAQKRIAALASDTNSPASPLLLGEVLLSLARMDSPDAAALARRHLDPPVPDQVRIRAIQALALTASDPKGDSVRLRKLASDESNDIAVRLTAFRSLGAYPNNLSNLRLLHDTLADADPVLVPAALDALERIASKETSRPYLVKVVKSDLGAELKRRAARILVGLDDVTGARILVKPYKKNADDNSRDWGPQRIAADEFYKLGAYADAYTYYDRALRAPNVSRRYEIQIWMARCKARLGQFESARKLMKDAGYKSLAPFKDDDAFAGMRKEPRYTDLFATKDL